MEHVRTTTLETINVLLISQYSEDVHDINRLLNQDIGRHFILRHANRLSHALEDLAQTVSDIILLDMALPDSYGVEAVERIQQAAPDVPVIILSSEWNEEEERIVLHKGAQDYLVRHQIDELVFSRAIRYAIDRHRVKSQLAQLTQRLKEANIHLERLTLVDPLTELLNRRGLQSALDREIERCNRDGSELVCLLLDLDDFKQINDILGHPVGDIVLKEISGMLRKSLRTTDYIARIGGDEFLMLLPQTRLAEGLQVAEKLRLAVSGVTISLPTGIVNVTASIGVTMVVPPLKSIDDLLGQTHQLLRLSKQSGKNQVFADRPSRTGVPAPASGDESAGSNGSPPLLYAMEQLRKGGQFRSVLQPIFYLPDWTTVGYELFSRSTIKVFEMPDDFFRVSLEDQLLTYVDHQCFRTCVAAASALPAHPRRHINIFPSTLLELPIAQILQDCEEDRKRSTYCFEISQRRIVGEPSYLTQPIRALKEAGVLIAIDDVGFGRTSLESLILLEPEIIKIDNRLIHGISRDTSRVRSLKRLLKMATSLGIEVIAEGIEAHADLLVLQELGVTFGQGFLWGKPE